MSLDKAVWMVPIPQVPEQLMPVDGDVFGFEDADVLAQARFQCVAPHPQKLYKAPFGGGGIAKLANKRPQMISHIAALGR